MKTTTTTSPARAPAEVGRPLQIVLTFDQQASATAARKLLDAFLSSWSADFDIHRDEWSFSELEHPKFRSEALELARTCDIFVIAISGIIDLPESFMEWFEDWAQSRSESETAVILLFVPRGANISNLRHCVSLPDWADKRGLAFFSTFVAPSGVTLPPALHPKSLLAGLGTLETLPDFSGLND